MTPWIFGLLVDSYNQKIRDEHDHDAWIMWHGAQLTRIELKSFPKLEHYLADGKKIVPAIDEGAIIERLKAHNHRELSKGKK